LGFFTLEDWTDRLSWNVGTELPVNAAYYSRRAQISIYTAFNVEGEMSVHIFVPFRCSLLGRKTGVYFILIAAIYYRWLAILKKYKTRSKIWPQNSDDIASWLVIYILRQLLLEQGNPVFFSSCHNTGRKDGTWKYASLFRKVLYRLCTVQTDM
jgi:hypothetical protein